ncbi:endonuclease/exonuclease/phosphatase family protein [cf. Phormidesmis sp. LEGE 11477]|uniref:endonuclease/exonuclease/phosphatase family protein n=1 Tax=cf. Phormidesmis sp. LEGE 11477 TaxID=1828680 RepID=UPI001881640C|nr:endonuclease/exonuclease/phosphatase family protein [cf. Phormidesmis sp. LEGE 11477]MBE9061235.1 endonuclease/exonuclease/phosphatase family protein [cf. Phormidesmis sp. LEGE 11477]
MKIFLKLLGLAVGLPTVAIALFYFWGSSSGHSQKNYADTVSYTEGGGLNYGAVFVPGETIHSIVSYNLGYLSGMTNNTTAKLDRAAFDANQQQVIAALNELGPDIVALQEVDFGSQRSYEVDQSQAIAQGLGLDFGAIAIGWDKNYVPFPYWPPAAHFGKMLSGQSIISRHPIQENSRLVLEKVADNPFYYNAFYLDRLAQVTQVQFGEQPLIVINVHLEAFDEPTRVSQTQFVRSLAEDYAKTYPVILVGDFNSALNRGTFIDASGVDHGETQFSIKEMLASEVLASAVPEADWSENLTFPSNQPEYKLDYIFYTPDTIEIVETQVLTAAGEASDHLPLMMQFRLK